MPPDTLRLTAPLLPPLQLTFDAVADPASRAGCVMATVTVLTHPFASVTVHVYEPAASPLAVAAVPPLGDHAYVYGDVPPLTFATAFPLLPPKQFSFADEAMETEGLPELLTLAVVAEVQPFASVTVHVYEPATSPVAVALVPPDGAQL